MSCTQQRTKKALKTCDGRPGIVPWVIHYFYVFTLVLSSPLNFLNPRHRLVYVLACGVIASQWYELIMISANINVNKWASPIVHRKYLINGHLNSYIESSHLHNVSGVCDNYYHISYPGLCGGTYTSCGIHYGSHLLWYLVSVIFLTLFIKIVIALHQWSTY